MILVGSEFKYFGAETENGLTYKEVRDLGTANDDLSVRYVQYGILKLIPFKDVNKHDYSSAEFLFFVRICLQTQTAHTGYQYSFCIVLVTLT